VQQALNADQAGHMDLPALHLDQAGFRFAMNEDAMAGDKLSEGIRAFCADALKLDKLLHTA
jgi:transaldolase